MIVLKSARQKKFQSNFLQSVTAREQTLIYFPTALNRRLITSNRLRNSVKHDWKNVHEDIWRGRRSPQLVEHSAKFINHRTQRLTSLLIKTSSISITFCAITTMTWNSTPTGLFAVARLIWQTNRSYLRSRLPHDSQISPFRLSFLLSNELKCEVRRERKWKKGNRSFSANHPWAAKVNIPTSLFRKAMFNQLKLGRSSVDDDMREFSLKLSFRQ